MQKVGVLRGGISDEYFLSLESGNAIINALKEEGYDVTDMLIDREGVLHIWGVPAGLEDINKKVDLVWNSLHGRFGEDGGIQELFENHGIPYTGSGILASSITHNKKVAKDFAKSLGLNTPESLLVIPEGGESVSEVTQNIYKKMAPPWVVKPLRGGSSIRTYFAFTPLELAQFVEESISYAEPFLVEQYIFGREAAVGVIDGFRGQDSYALPVVEVKSPTRGIHTHEDRKKDESFVVGGNFRNNEKEMLTKLAKDLHKHFNAKDYSQSEFIVDKQGKVWFIETDTSPLLHDKSPFVKALQAVGSSLKELVRVIVKGK
jgi:D-alanine-D-alanine ligase